MGPRRRSSRPLPGPNVPVPAPSGDFAYACDLFDAGFPRDAHEEWEVSWRALPRDSAEATFLKGLLCASAFVVKHRERSPGAPVLWRRTVAAFEVAPTGYGLVGADIVARLAVFAEDGTWPTLP